MNSPLTRGYKFNLQNGRCNKTAILKCFHNKCISQWTFAERLLKFFCTTITADFNLKMKTLPKSSLEIHLNLVNLKLSSWRHQNFSYHYFATPCFFLYVPGLGWRHCDPWLLHLLPAMATGREIFACHTKQQIWAYCSDSYQQFIYCC